VRHAARESVEVTVRLFDVHERFREAHALLQESPDSAAEEDGKRRCKNERKKGRDADHAVTRTRASAAASWARPT